MLRTRLSHKRFKQYHPEIKSNVNSPKYNRDYKDIVLVLLHYVLTYKSDDFDVVQKVCFQSSSYQSYSNEHANISFLL